VNAPSPSAATLYVGSVMHRRFAPQAHRFRYRAFWMLLDLEQLEALSQQLKLFSFGRFNLFSLFNSDHGDGSDVPLSIQIAQHLARSGIDLGGGKVRLLCMPRVLGYGFNPISIYYCQYPDGRLAAMIYEVHNTFGERHSYLIPVASDARTIHQRCSKELYVSPFMDMEMQYQFWTRVPDDQIAVSIHTGQFGKTIMSACLAGTRRTLDDASLLRAFLMVPVLTIKVIAAIHFEALRLWLKGLKLRSRPAPPEQLVTAIPAISQQID
jgi:DUF1365 family protein